MRNPNRLYNFYENLRDIHMAYFPDWRFGQFISNFVDWCYTTYRKDIFFVEDDKMSELFKEYYLNYIFKGDDK